MMDIRVRLFAGLRESFDSEFITVSVPDECNTHHLKQVLMQVYPAHAERLGRALIAVNRRYASSVDRIDSGDEVALIPPVGGGSTDVPSCLLTKDELSLQEAMDALSSSKFGGTTLFVGTVREWTAGRRTSHLEYEAYYDMALATMKDIEFRVQTAFPQVQTLQWHRIGRLHPTDIAVICAAAAPHREDAFLASRELIERLKQEVPIWKKESYDDGSHTWPTNA